MKIGRVAEIEQIVDHEVDGQIHRQHMRAGERVA